jgi:hypothetical protein
VCVRCRTKIEPRKRKCPACGGKPSKPFPDHRYALKQPREVFVAANGGFDGCWVCRDLGLELGGRLQRDHDHRTGEPRGLLCVFHNRRLGPVYTAELLGAYLRYVTKKAA